MISNSGGLVFGNIHKCMKNKSIQLITVGILIFLFTEFLRLYDSGEIFEFRVLYNRPLIEPLESFSIIVFLIGIYLVFFSEPIQQIWWRWFRWLVLPLFILLLLMNYEGTGGFTAPAVVVVYWGTLVGIATLIQTLFNRFYLKTGVLDK